MKVKPLEIPLKGCLASLAFPPFQKFLEQRVALGLCGGCGRLVVLGGWPGMRRPMRFLD